MKTVVFFGDSNTWGADPEKQGERLAPGSRLAGIADELLGKGFWVAEEGVCGRTTAFDDPIDPFKNGVAYIDCCMLTHMPVDLLVIMLGTNDLKRHLHQNAFSSSKGLELVIRRAQQSEYGRAGRPPGILVVSPVHVAENIEKTWIGAYIDNRGREIGLALAGYYEQVAKAYGCGFLDAAKVAKASELDAVHMKEEEHRKLACAIVEKIKEML